MNALVLFLLLGIQGIPVQPAQSGTITGVLKDSSGKPAGGIRVAAVPRPNSVDELAGNTAAMASQGETDELGRYTLEGVPPGRYLVAAGILSLPTYYPGTQAMAEGKIIAVAPGETVSRIDFTMKDTSGGRVIGTGGGLGGGGFAVPLDIRVENGGKVPIFGAGKTTGVQLVPVAGGPTISATVTSGAIPLQPTAADYRVTMEGLPDGYSVQSMKYGSTDIQDGILRISTPAVSVTQTTQGTVVFTFGGGGTTLLNTFGGAISPGPIPQTLSIVLIRAPAPKTTGVNVTGQFAPTIRGAFLSGNPGTIYADHSFEFSGVQPGRHALTAFSNSLTPLAASLIVGDKDVNGIELEETSALPLNARTPTPPGPTGNRAPGRLPLAAVRGKIVDSETGELLTRGDVFLVGDYWTGHPLNSTGNFEFGKLLPGTYQIEVKAVGYPTFRQEFSLDEQDLELEVRSGP